MEYERSSRPQSPDWSEETEREELRQATKGIKITRIGHLDTNICDLEKGDRIEARWVTDIGEEFGTQREVLCIRDANEGVTPADCRYTRSAIQLVYRDTKSKEIVLLNKILTHMHHYPSMPSVKEGVLELADMSEARFPQGTKGYEELDEIVSKYEL